MATNENKALEQQGQAGYKKGHKTVAYLQKCKDQGKKIVQHCPGLSSYELTMAADICDVDICRLPPRDIFTDYVTVDDLIACGPATVHSHRKYAPHIHINYWMETPVFVNKERAVSEGVKLIYAGASSFLCMGISNEVVKFMADNYVPTFGHVGAISGWQPNATGGYKKLGKTAEDAMRVYRWAYEYQENGMSGMTIELVPGEVSAAIAKKLRVPVVGIASGATGGELTCDGYEMVDGDLLGMNPAAASHAKGYGNLLEFLCSVYGAWVNDVRTGAYPEEKHGWHMDPAEYEKFMKAMEQAE